MRGEARGQEAHRDRHHGAPLPRRLQEVPCQLRQQLPPLLGKTRAIRPLFTIRVVLLIFFSDIGFLGQVKHFDRQYSAKKRVQRLLDGGDDRRGPISLPQPYTFKQ